MSAATVRKAIQNLVEDRLEEEGVPYHRAKILKPGERPCQLANPLCVDDLCVLPRHHVGSDQGYHVLGTTAYNCAEQFPEEWMQPTIDTRHQLIQAGCRLQRRMFPEEARR